MVSKNVSSLFNIWMDEFRLSSYFTSAREWPVLILFTFFSDVPVLLGLKDQLLSKDLHNFVHAIQIKIDSVLYTKVQTFGYPRFIIYIFFYVFPLFWGMTYKENLTTFYQYFLAHMYASEDNHEIPNY